MTYLAQDNSVEKQAMRDAYCEALIILGEENANVLAVEADVMNSMGTVGFAKRFPERSINCGIQEANAVSMSAGLSMIGFIPFFHAFGVFATRRVFDQTLISCAYSKANVKIIGGDSGICATINGGTHMAMEDAGIMRNIPGMTVLDPADTTAMKALVRLMAEKYGNFYMRFNRKPMAKIYSDDAQFEIGKAQVLQEGGDVTIIAAGLLVSEALKAASALVQKGFGVRVVDMFTIKPADKECIIESAQKTGAIVTAENHNIVNGLGSAVAEVLGEHAPVPLERIGVCDTFGEVGDLEYLLDRFQLSAKYIEAKALLAIERKKTK
jgi:transketolase